jgi:TRAP-type transport system periplasmic protein
MKTSQLSARRTVVGTLSAILFFVFGQALAQPKPLNLRLAHGATADQAIGKAMHHFAEQVKKKTNGAVTVETHLAGSLYNERTAIEALINGSVDLAGASNANWGAFTNTLLFMDLPYVFRDEASFRKALDGGVGAEIRKRFERDGFKLLAMLDNGGFRDVVNNRREIRTPSDLKGLKMRTTASPVEIEMFRNWGAIPTAIDWAEVYNALASGVVDGEFVMPSWLSTAKHYEVLKFATEVQAVIGIQTLAMRKERFDRLPKDVQAAIIEAGRDAEVLTAKLDKELSDTARQHARSLGVKTYTPSPQELELWRKTGREIWSKFDQKVDKELLKAVLDSQK